MVGSKWLKFLVEVGVSKKVENWLHSHGYDVKCARDLESAYA